MTPPTIRLVPSGDPLSLAALPTVRPEVPEIAPIDRKVAHRIVGASIRVHVCTTPTMISPTPEPHSARRHIALEGA